MLGLRSSGARERSPAHEFFLISKRSFQFLPFGRTGRLYRKLQGHFLSLKYSGFPRHSRPQPVRAGGPSLGLTFPNAMQRSSPLLGVKRT